MPFVSCFKRQKSKKGSIVTTRLNPNLNYPTNPSPVTTPEFFLKKAPWISPLHTPPVRRRLIPNATTTMLPQLSDGRNLVLSVKDWLRRTCSGDEQNKPCVQKQQHHCTHGEEILLLDRVGKVLMSTKLIPKKGLKETRRSNE